MRLKKSPGSRGRFYFGGATWEERDVSRSEAVTSLTSEFFPGDAGKMEWSSSAEHGRKLVMHVRLEGGVGYFRLDVVFMKVIVGGRYAISLFSLLSPSSALSVARGINMGGLDGSDVVVYMGG
jgi:hypothetical protein